MKIIHIFEKKEQNKKINNRHTAASFIYIIRK